MTEQSFETLQVWQKAHQLMLDIYKNLIPRLPKEEKYDLADQLRRHRKVFRRILRKAPADIIIWTMFAFAITREAHWMKP